MKIISKLGILLLTTLLAVTLAACGQTSGYDPSKPAFPTVAPNPEAAKLPVGVAGPIPNAKVILPQDEAPHNDITEWWYYTGHMNTVDGRKYGFEFVIFQANQSDYPTGYVSHFAVTDLNTQKFDVSQKLQVASQPVKFGGTDGFNLSLDNWKLNGLDGSDHIQAKSDDGVYAIDLNLKDQKGIALHGGSGEFSYGPAGSSYYYSRPLMALNGTLTVEGQSAAVTGQTWFDHQWGNFISQGDGGWEWFSTQLNDNSELMLYYLKDINGNLLQAFGSYIPPCSATNPCDPSSDKPIKTVELDGNQFNIKDTSQWTSPLGITYPASWHVEIKGSSQMPPMSLDYKPRLANQELDTRPTTGLTYWEGDSAITGTANGQPIAGDGYVELTGYNKK